MSMLSPRRPAPGGWLGGGLQSHGQGTSDLFANSRLASSISGICVADRRNSRLLRAIRASNLDIPDRNLLRSG
jgi:hypothetical protein